MSSPPDQLFQSAFEHAAIGMALVSPDGRFLRVNRSTCRLLGYSEEDLLVRDFQQITHPDDLDIDLAHVEMMLRGEIESYQLEKRYLHREGHAVWTQLSVSLMRAEDGKPRFFIAQIQDISSRKETEVTLKKTLLEKGRLLHELEESTAMLRKLQHGLITVCAWTKRVQHEGAWISVDEFMSKHLGLKLSHGISDEAAIRFLQKGDANQMEFPGEFQAGA